MPEVTDPNLLQQLNGGARSGPQPVLTIPDTGRAIDDARADAEAARNAENDAANRKLARNRIIADLEQRGQTLDENDNIVPIPGWRPKASTATEAQQKSSLFYGRMLAAERQYNGIPMDSRDARTVPGQWFAETFPSVDGMLSTSDRKSADNAARNFIAASLRQESGAAISEEEYRNQYRIFFPMPGDTERQIQEKALLRRQAMEGFKINSGPLAPDVEAEFARIYGPQDGASDAQQGGPTISEADKKNGYTYTDAEGNDWVVGPLDRVDGNDPGYMQVAAGVGDIVEGGINNTVGLVANPVNTAIFRGLGYENYTSDLGQTVRDILGLPEGDPRISAIVQAATGGLTLGGGAAASATRAAPGLARSALAQYGVNPVGDAIVAGSAAASGEAAREAGAGPVGQFAATLAGGVAPAAFTGRLARNAPTLVRPGPGGGPRGGAPLTEGGEVIASADRLNAQFGTKIEPMPADVGGPMVRRVTGGAAQFPISAQPIISTGKAVSAETQAARDAIARMAGNALDPEGAGQAALAGAQKYMKTSKTKVDALYSKARRLGGDQLVDLRNARDVLDGHIAELSQTPGGATGLARMKALRAELDQPYPVEGIKRMRTSLRDEFVSDGLRGTDIERRMKQVIQAADDDIAEGLEAAGKADAADAYREAATAHRERVETIDEVLAPFIGKDGDRSGEQVFAAIGTATAKNNRGLKAFMDALPTEDAGTVRASLIGALGKSSKGRQNADGDAFSAGEFLTHWNAMSAGAKSTLFGGELRAALDDLARVTEGTKEAQKYANFSNTGSVMGMSATGANGAYAYAEPVTGGALLALQYAGGKLLASPRIARWIAKMPKEPGKARMHLEGLKKIAGAERGIMAGEVNAFYQRLANDFTVNAGPRSLAAQPAQDDEAPQSAKPTTTGAQR